MSTEPAGVDGKFEPHQHLNVSVSREEWCDYHEICKIDRNCDRNLCIYCKHRKPLDIKLMLDLEYYERKKQNANHICTTISNANALSGMVVE